LHAIPPERLEDSYLKKLFSGIGHGMYLCDKQYKGDLKTILYALKNCLKIIYKSIIQLFPLEASKKLRLYYKSFTWKAYIKCALGRSSEWLSAMDVWSYANASTNIGMRFISDSKNAEDKILYLKVKRIMDIVFACVGLIVCAPLFLIIALAIYIADGKQVIYKQTRVGKYGRNFTIYKFRTMKINADMLHLYFTPEEYENFKKKYKLENDRRVTKIGKFLRKYSLDELPQLINIIKGDMSFVGPRPVLQEETELYGDKRDLLLSVRPGLTGYWQTNGRSNTTYHGRMEMELYYCENFNFMLDLKIMLKTIFQVLSGKGAR